MFAKTQHIIYYLKAINLLQYQVIDLLLISLEYDCKQDYLYLFCSLPKILDCLTLSKKWLVVAEENGIFLGLRCTSLLVVAGNCILVFVFGNPQSF